MLLQNYKYNATFVQQTMLSMGKRFTRFLIDKVDERLNDVEKEKKFDIGMITVGGLICVIGIYLLVLQVDKGGPSIIIGLLLLIIGFFVSYTMIKEFIADCKKTKNNSK